MRSWLMSIAIKLLGCPSATKQASNSSTEPRWSGDLIVGAGAHCRLIEPASLRFIFPINVKKHATRILAFIDRRPIDLRICSSELNDLLVETFALGIRHSASDGNPISVCECRVGWPFLQLDWAFFRWSNVQKSKRRDYFSLKCQSLICRR